MGEVGFAVGGGGTEDGGAGGADFPEGDGVAVGFVVLAHEAEWVVGYGAGEGDVGLDAPVPVVGEQGGMGEEGPGVEAAHVVVAFEVGVGEPFGFLGGHALEGMGLVDVGWVRPHGWGNDLKGEASARGCGEGRYEVLFPRLVV